MSSLCLVMSSSIVSDSPRSRSVVSPCTVFGVSVCVFSRPALAALLSVSHRDSTFFNIAALFCLFSRSVSLPSNKVFKTHSFMHKDIL